jgi:hypothetical protein
MILEASDKLHSIAEELGSRLDKASKQGNLPKDDPRVTEQPDTPSPEPSLPH